MAPLASIPTRDLVTELSQRAGVSAIVVDPEQRYTLSVTDRHAAQAATAVGDFGPAILMVVVD